MLEAELPQPREAALPKNITGSLGEMFRKRLGLSGCRKRDSETRWGSEPADQDGSVSSKPDLGAACGWPWRGLDFVPKAMLIYTSLWSEKGGRSRDGVRGSPVPVNFLYKYTI